jgi:predicted metal-dependent hydrolase
VSESSFTYLLRESARAKNVRLRVTPQRGLEVIVPANFDQQRIHSLLELKKSWIRAALERAEDTRKFFEPRPSWRLPSRIHLQAIGRVYQVDAKETDAPAVTVRTVGLDTIKIYGCIEDERACQISLVRWLSRQAREHLIPRLHVWSATTGLKYQQVFIRQQRTRWASCSRHRNISLNLQLLFLPAPLIDYVFIHELCHLDEMSHSKHFWAEVERHCPNYRKLDALLRDMWKSVPRWAAPFNVETSATRSCMKAK